MMDVLGRRIVRGRKLVAADGERPVYRIVGGLSWAAALVVAVLAAGGLLWLSWVWR